MNDSNSRNLLEGFKTVALVTGVPTLSITKNGFGFNKTCVLKMEQCRFVNLMIDECGGRLAIQKSDESQHAATPFFRGQVNMNVRWNNADLMKRIEHLTGWDLSQCGYRLDGEYFEEISAMIFNLSSAEVITS